jgi:hypothetical protein
VKVKINADILSQATGPCAQTKKVEKSNDEQTKFFDSKKKWKTYETTKILPTVAHTTRCSLKNETHIAIGIVPVRDPIRSSDSKLESLPLKSNNQQVHDGNWTIANWSIMY